ncbi:MAG: hypothetical protein H0W02_19465 [Ktedonobacteraceae bacterium]|nr:hypothetical protein [Ktedonobacteraceae bacterium]
MSSRKKAPQGMYSAQEAIAVIGIPSTNFYSLVNEGTIKKIVLPDRKEGYYSKAEIDNYARNRRALQQPYSTEKLHFGLALNEDIPAIHALTASVSGGEAHAVPEEILRAWIRKNPQAVHILRKGTEIVGYISAFALSEATLDLRLRGKLLNRTLPIDDIMPFISNTTLSLYIAEMAVKHTDAFIKDNEPNPDKPDPVARLLGARLIRETSRFINGLKKQGIVIKELYAVGTSPFGIRMCRELGMTPVDLLEGVRPDRIPFKIDLQQSSQSVIMRRLRVV